MRRILALAGPWVERTYDIELSVTADLAAAFMAEYRPSFEAQGTQ